MFVSGHPPSVCCTIDLVSVCFLCGEMIGFGTCKFCACVHAYVHTNIQTLAANPKACGGLNTIQVMFLMLAGHTWCILCLEWYVWLIVRWLWASGACCQCSHFLSPSTGQKKRFCYAAGTATTWGHATWSHILFDVAALAGLYLRADARLTSSERSVG